MDVLRLLRVKHWIKNTFVLAPLVFSISFLSIPQLLRSLAAFLAFCFASSFTYVINDIADRNNDRVHPEKKIRPVASGRIKVISAMCIAMIMLLGSVSITLLLDPRVLAVVCGYIALNILYSFVIKKFIIIDVISISLGFVLRVVSGALAIDVTLSSWILLCTLFITLFLAFGKRRNELVHLENHSETRNVLNDYSESLLSAMIVASMTLTIITYSLYVVDDKTVEKLGSDKLIYTLPLVLYGMFRYLHRLFTERRDSDLADILLKDRWMLIDVVLWVIAVVVILLVENRGFPV